MKIAIDFDGVLVERDEIPRLTDISQCPPTKHALAAVSQLMTLGHELYVLTNRTVDEWEQIHLWLDKYSFPNLRITNVKEKGTSIYLDDRAIRFTNWLDITKLFI